MTYKKGQWLESLEDRAYYTKGKNYRIAGVYKDGEVGIVNDSDCTNYFIEEQVEKHFKPAKKTFYTLEVGDVVVDEYEDERPVLEVLDNVFLVSFSDDKGAGGFFYTPQSAIDKGWTIKVAEEEVEELTMQEVCKELGRTIKIKK